MNDKTLSGNEKGMVLVTVLLLIAVSIILGTTAVMQTSTDLKISTNYKTGKEAFYGADAGVQYVLKKLASDLDAGVVDLTAETIPLSYSAPSGFSFTPSTTLTPLGSNRYRFQVTGYGSNGAQLTLEVVLSAKPKSAFDYGLFTDGLLDLKSDAHVYSYDSRDTPNPDPTAFPGVSTGAADIASNTAISTKMATYIDGDLALGADDSDPPVPAVWTDTGTPTITGTSGATVERVDPDPLGANDPTSTLYTKFTDVITNNDNGVAGDDSPLQGATMIYLNNGDTLTLTAGDYYLTGIVLKNGSTLEVDATDGPVNIYLSGTIDAEEGELEAKNGSVINNMSQPTDFNIFSNSYQDIVFKHSSDFKGMIYAPNAHVELKNSAGVYGLIWGHTATIHNSGEFYFDEAIKDKFTSNSYTVQMVAWKDTSLDI